jgi:alpha-1,3-rhamnosyl/mannosyltransferase
MAAPASPKLLSKETVQEVVAKFRLPKRYLLSPTNQSIHKNSGALMAAFARLRKLGYHKIALVFVGPGTENYYGRACEEGLETGMTPQDVFGLGYVSHMEIEALIQGATMLVNPSLYEGGNCPGFDAWIRGVPVAMSNLPPFIEHMQFHGVKATVFDPRNVVDIVDKLAFALEHPEVIKEGAAASVANMCRYTWDKAAESYFKIFDEVVRCRV